MPTEKHVTNFVINKVPTKSIFEKMKTQGLINDDEIYLVEEDDSANYLQLSGGTMTGTLTTKDIKLTPGTDYGTTLPSSPATNQLFFQTVGTNFVLDNVYPVGSIYMNVNSTNPGTLFGGTWDQIQGKFLLGMSSSYPAGSSGGSETVTLTEKEIPTMEGFLYSNEYSKIATSVPVGGGSGSAQFLNRTGDNWTQYGDHPRGWYMDGQEAYPAGVSRGGGMAHNNMPPYLSVHIWKRTA